MKWDEMKWNKAFYTHILFILNSYIFIFISHLYQQSILRKIEIADFKAAHMSSYEIEIAKKYVIFD